MSMIPIYDVVSPGGNQVRERISPASAVPDLEGNMHSKRVMPC